MVVVVAVLVERVAGVIVVALEASVIATAELPSKRRDTVERAAGWLDVKH